MSRYIYRTFILLETKFYIFIVEGRIYQRSGKTKSQKNIMTNMHLCLQSTLSFISFTNLFLRVT